MLVARYCPLSSAAKKRLSSFMFFASKALRDDLYLLNIRNFSSLTFNFQLDKVDLVHIDGGRLHLLTCAFGHPFPHHHRALHLVQVHGIQLRAVHSPLSRDFTQEGVGAVRQSQHHRVDGSLVARLAFRIFASHQRALIQYSNNSFHNVYSITYNL